VDIHEVTFRGAALKRTDRPREWLPHVAVAGRSNVGKSSLLNWMFRRTVAKVAKSPGKTRTLNFFLVNRSFYVVDLPGYGYAKVSKDLREQWGRELDEYLTRDERLAGVVSLVDVRHPPTPLDLSLQEMLLATGRERVVVLTKADKVGRGERRRRQMDVQRAFALATPPLVVSVTTGDGRRELLAAIDGLVTAWRQRHTGETDGTQEEVGQ
jgi:GTP-binding protein